MNKVSVDVMKKYIPKELKPSNLRLFMADVKIRMLAAEEITKTIDETIRYNQIQQKEGTRD